MVMCRQRLSSQYFAHKKKLNYIEITRQVVIKIEIVCLRQVTKFMHAQYLTYTDTFFHLRI